MGERYTVAPPPGAIEPPELKVYLDQELRRIAGAFPDGDLEGSALLFGTTDDIVANDVTATPVVNFSNEFNDSIIGLDRVSGEVQMNERPALVRFDIWFSASQVTAFRNFTIQLVGETNGVFDSAVIASGYIPQIGFSVEGALSAALVRTIAGGETFRLGLIIDGAPTATFAISDCSVHVQYLTFRG